VGEAEALIGPLCDALRSAPDRLPARLVAEERPDVGRSPTPRFDLLEVDAYQSIGVQWSRGCPFNCEFCDIIEVFGRRPRMKSQAQFLRELEALYATGYRGSLFVVDDNFIGNKAEVRRLLPPLTAWMRAHRDPFALYTEASLNLAADPAMVDAMVEAGFTSVFVGVETPSEEALRGAGKLQNTGLDLEAAVRLLSERGLEVMAGFIVGFDSDDAAAIERQRAWIARSPIPLAMVGLLTALPGTRLTRRLSSEGRLRVIASGDNLARPNFVTRMDEGQLLAGYARLMTELYSPAAYFERAARSLELAPKERSRFRYPARYALGCVLRSLVRQGVLAPYRRHYWRFLGRILRHAPARFGRAIGLAINGEHLIRYTVRDALPALRAPVPLPRLSAPALPALASG